MFGGGSANTASVEAGSERITGTTGITGITGITVPDGVVLSAADKLDLLEAVEAEIAEIAGHLNALHGRLVDVAGVVIDHDLWHGFGYRSPSHWLGMRAGLAQSRARDVVTAAERRSELPCTLGALGEGRLSLDQVMPVVRRAPAWAEKAVAEFALHGTVSQIRSVVNRYPFDAGAPDDESECAPVGDTSDEAADRGTAVGDTTAGGTDDDGAADGAAGVSGGPSGGASGGATGGPPPCEEYLSLIAELDGTWSLRGRLAADRGLEFDAALRAAGDALRRRHATAAAPTVDTVDDGHRSNGAVDVELSLIDAFAELVKRSFDADSEASRRDRYRVYLHIDTDGSISDPWHRSLPSSVARHLTCEADIRPVLSEGGVPIQVGRTRRRVDPDLRRMILWRDQGCGVPGCGVHHRLDVHHIRHWLDGGPTDTSNLIAVCPAHHRMIHRGELSMSGDADRAESLQFWNRHGRAFGASPPRRPTSPPPEPAAAYVRPLGERCQSWSVCFGIPPGAPRLIPSEDG